MSTDIRTTPVFLVECENCGFKTGAGSAGSAEQAAENHIEDWSEQEGRANYNHKLKITNYTVIGRQ